MIPSRSHALTFILYLVILQAASATTTQTARVVAATSANGKSITVYATGFRRRPVSLSQVNATAQIRFGDHEIRVADDGLVIIDDAERSRGSFNAIDIFIDDDDRIEFKVSR